MRLKTIKRWQFSEGCYNGRMNKRSALKTLLFCSLALAACGNSNEEEASVDAATSLVDASGAGQSDDASTAPDAANATDAAPSASAFDCAGQAPPDTVTAPPIVIAGTLAEATTNGVVALTQSAHVAALNYSDDSVIREGDFVQTFSITDPAASTTPLDAYIKAEVTGYLDAYVFPPGPIAQSLDNTPIIMLSNTVFGFISLLTGIATQAGTGTFTIAIVDCEGASVPGAVVSISPSVGTLKYADASGLPGMADFDSTQDAGIVYAFNLPPGEYTVSASVGAVDLRDNTVKAFGDSISTIVVAP